MLYYLPLEQYPERYTSLMSCRGGWTESHFSRLGIDYTRIDGKRLGNGTIGKGVVLDAFGRNYYAQSQTMRVVELLREGRIADGDVVYTEDFWHSGIDSLFYVRQLTGIRFRVGCFLHAQSVDSSDFCHAMRRWMRPIERGYGKGYDYIFVCSPILKRLCVKAGVGTERNVHVVGLPYNSARLVEQSKAMGVRRPARKDRSVIFSSRFDDEKDPMFFLDLVESLPEVSFRLVNPRKGRPISSNREVVSRLETVLSRKGSNLELVDTSDKARYYEALSRAKVQFNCAIQDWVSWTLLEAVTFGCLPLYPRWKDFPSELRNDGRFLYRRKDLGDARRKLLALLDMDASSVDLEHVVKKHDASWEKFAKIMKLTE